MANSTKTSKAKDKSTDTTKKKKPAPKPSMSVSGAADKKKLSVPAQKAGSSAAAKSPGKANTATTKTSSKSPVSPIKKTDSQPPKHTKATTTVASKSSGKKKKKGDDDEEPIIENIPIEQLPVLPSDITYRRSKSKLPPGGKRFVKANTINPHVIKDKPIEPEKVSKKIEPNGKFEMEFILHAPIGLLYDFLTTPSGLAEWFADDVDLKNDIYSFNWDGAKQFARIQAAKLDSFIRLHWMDKPEGTYFEFRIDADELTNEIALRITDFGENEDDIRTNRRLWDAQIQRLIKAMGSY